MFVPQILYLLTAGIAGLVALAWLNYKNADKVNQFNRWKFIVYFAFLSVLALFTARSYIYPNQDIFSNTKYHELQHLGFEFEKQLYLVRSDSTNQALWDDKSGQVALESSPSNGISLNITKYYEPFYVSNKRKDKPTNWLTRKIDEFFHKDDDSYILKNNIIDQDVTAGFTIEESGTELFKLAIVNLNDNNKEHSLYISTVNGIKDTSAFTQPINAGYPLMDILLKTPHISLPDDLKLLLNGALLVRQQIRDNQNSNRSPLRLFPGGLFYARTGVTVNHAGNYNPDQLFNITLTKGLKFFSGIGLSKSDVMTVDLPNDKKVRLLYELPKMHNLRDDEKDKVQDNRLFITSSAAYLENTELKGGYLFNIFESENNINHINATVRYKAGSPADSLFFKIKDLNYLNSKNNSQPYPADSVIHLQTKNIGSQLQWLFRFRNMRETNPLNLRHFEWFIGLFFALMCTRVAVDTLKFRLSRRGLFYNLKEDYENRGTATLPLIELSIYIVVFCFSFVRLILAWRMSTFPPTEGMGFNTFSLLTDGESVYWVTLWSTIAPVILIVLFRLYYNHHEHRLRKAPGVKYRYHYWVVLSYLTLLLFMLGLARLHFPERLTNIVLPVLLYIIATSLIKAEGIPGKTRTPIMDWIHSFVFENYAKILLWITAFVYLMIKDSGFGAIFGLCSLIHYFFGSAVNKQSKNYGWIMLLGIIIIFFLLKYESVLLISVFEHTMMYIVGAAIILALFTLLIKTNQYWLKIVRNIFASLAGIVVIVVCYITFLGQAVKNFDNGKLYLKYRAEIQQPDIKIQSLVKGVDYQSSDLDFILRSAHNQWFINQYSNIPHTKYFDLQPHFDFGSSYPTQTMDLVITRYIIAEHTPLIVFFLLIMLLILVLTYFLKIDIKTESFNFSTLGGLILIFSIAFFVALSATNRIVFFGQDFPFLSLLSKIAVGFPVAVFSLVILNSWIQGNKAAQSGNSRKIKLGLVLVTFLMCVACFAWLPSTRANVKTNVFKLDSLLNKTVAKVDSINNDFSAYQYDNRDKLENINADTLVTRYMKNSPIVAGFKNNTKDAFFISLLNNFETSKNRWNSDQLIHLRHRGDYYHIVLNDNYYSVRSFRDTANKWKGSLLAEKPEVQVGFISDNAGKIILPKINKKGEPIEGVIANVVPDLMINKYSHSATNIKITQLAADWSNQHEPIYLARSDEAVSAENDAMLHVINDTVNIDYHGNSIAMRLLNGDRVELDIRDPANSHLMKNKIGWILRNDSERFLAKNIWLNGKQDMWYPLGKEFMWSYNFANLVNEVREKKEESAYADSDLRVSIDYDLTKSLYRVIDSIDRSKFILNDNIRQKLLSFAHLDERQWADKNNKSGIYLDNNILKINEGSRFYKDVLLKKQLSIINQKLNPQLGRIDNKNIKTTVLSIAGERQFDYSAVAIDGFGRIRSLFDYNRSAKVDPNNPKEFNRSRDRLIQQSTISEERNFFGNKSLLNINSGPASSFKPILFTAVTSQLFDFGWETLSVDDRDIGQQIYEYGHKSLEMRHGWKLDRDPSISFSEPNYLVYSNNVFHSLVVFLGSRSRQSLMDGPNKGRSPLFLNVTAQRSKYFPAIKYKGQEYVINKDEWGIEKAENYFENTNSILAEGLKQNFGLPIIKDNQTPPNLFGNDKIFGELYSKGQTSGYFRWAYPELSSFYMQDRERKPDIYNGLIQPTLGAFPVNMTPLAMAIAGMRLATLNRDTAISTLSTTLRKPAYSFFKIYAHDSSQNTPGNYFKFYQENVLRQLNGVIFGNGTAKLLAPYLSRYHNKYFFYAKTGTLNVDNTDNEEIRERHLLLIITNQSLLDKMFTVNDLPKLKYYVIYMSYHGVNKADFINEDMQKFIFDNYKTVIDEVINSYTFKNYMEKSL